MPKTKVQTAHDKWTSHLFGVNEVDMNSYGLIFYGLFSYNLKSSKAITRRKGRELVFFIINKGLLIFLYSI